MEQWRDLEEAAALFDIEVAAFRCLVAPAHSEVYLNLQVELFAACLLDRRCCSQYRLRRVSLLRLVLAALEQWLVAMSAALVVVLQ